MKPSAMSVFVLLAALMASVSAQAYEQAQEKPLCKKPRFTDFSLPEYNASENNEVNPEQEFFFKLPAYADATSITMTAKNRPLPFKVHSTSTFHKVVAQLPAALTGQFVRIDVYAQSLLGCDHHDGWLIKISGHRLTAPPSE